MEDKYPLNMSQRGFSREGMRAPSREGQGATPEIRKKMITTTKTGLSISGQNFFNPNQRSQQELPTGDDDLTLASVNLGVDEKAFTSNMKVDILQLQEEINKLDLDGRIRNLNPSGILKKNHVYAMAKFLSKYAGQNSKTVLDKRMAFGASADPAEILNLINVKSESEGVRKLYKLLGALDLMLVKLTEFQIVSFLNYDQIFEDIRKQFGGQPSTKTASMDGGISISRFQVDLANLERLSELYSYVKKLSQQNKQAGGSRPNLNEGSAVQNFQSVDELYRSFRSGDSLGFNDDFIKSLTSVVEKSADFKTKENNLKQQIKDLQKELSERNNKLSTLVEFSASNQDNDKQRELEEKIQQLTEESDAMRSELEAQFKKDLSKKESELKEKVRKLEYSVETKDDEIHKLKTENEKLKSAPQAPPSGSAKEDVFNSEYYIKMIKQIEDNFGVKAREAEDANHLKDKEIATLKTKLEITERERDDYLERLTDLENLSSKPRKGDDNSFEAALREQFNQMKEGFENRIKNLMNEIQQIKKEKSIENLELKKDLAREKENRELLLRKLQIYTKT